MTYYGLEHSYSKFSGKKLKEQLSSFLPTLPGVIDSPGQHDNSSLRSVIEKPPIGGKELLPLTSIQLDGFRLHPGPVSLIFFCATINYYIYIFSYLNSIGIQVQYPLKNTRTNIRNINTKKVDYLVKKPPSPTLIMIHMKRNTRNRNDTMKTRNGKRGKKRRNEKNRSTVPNTLEVSHQANIRVKTYLKQNKLIFN